MVNADLEKFHQFTQSLQGKRKKKISFVDQINLETYTKCEHRLVSLKQICCSPTSNNHKNMADAALVVIAKVVLQQLASPAVKEFKLLWGHKKQLKKLEDTINTIKNVLEDAEQRRPTDTAVQGWLERLRIVLYDADDLFDEISHKVLHEENKTGSKIGKEVSLLLPNPCHFAFVFKTTQKVKAIRKCLDHIAKDINQFNFIPSQYWSDQEQPNRVRREQTHSYVPSSEVVGRDQEREDLVKLLLPDNCEDKRGVSVVAVIGMGGLGKTTLGQYVYSDERVKQDFDLRMWCCVNYFSDLKVALEAIIKSATGGAAPKRLDVDQLQGLLRKSIEGKRFLLVLDDVWDENAQNWRKLRIFLDSGKGGSVVLATTRSVEVARSMGAAKPYYHLQGLSDESAWLLFKKIAFGDESEGQNCRDMEELGRQIVKKCGNVPLAVEIIAGMLRDVERNKWFPLVDDELSKVIPDEYGKVMQVLRLSYNTLPSPVKRCFAYFSLFFKDVELDKDMLVRLWIAQGFVENCAAGQSLEDVAEDYFFCLVNRCFIQNCEWGSSFKMHDLVHDLALKVDGSESILVDKIGPNFGDNTIRHVSLHGSFTDVSVEQLSSVSQLKKLRTFLLERQFGSFDLHKIKNVGKLIPCFKSVRVLNLSSIDIKKIPDSVGQLIHLRYLDLTRIKMEMLPSSICSLHHLQYMILGYCRSLKVLPKELGKLISLRHLEIIGCSRLSQMPAGLENLTSLMTLDRLIVHSSNGGLRYLECLDNLSGSLGIELPGTVVKNAAIEADKACLSKKHRLRNLHIHWKLEVLEAAETVMNALQPHSNLESLTILRFGGEKMPRWIGEIHNLVSLTIEDCGRCVELPSLSHLQFLKKLEIGRMSSMIVIEDDGIGSISDNFDSKFFPSLETLYIYEMPNLTGWWKQVPSVQPAFRCVAKATIVKCLKLTACMPLFPQAEVLVMSGIQDKLFWHAIGSDGASRLKTLSLDGIHGLRSLPGARIRHLSTLRKLDIRCLQELVVSFVSGLEYLTSLEELCIWRCENLEWIDNDDVTVRSQMPGEQLPRLRKLEISVVDRNVLCKLLKYLTSLEKLVVEEFKEDLQQLNEEDEEGMVWKSLQKLRYLTVRRGFDSVIICETLPRGVKYLTSLQELNIQRCKELCLLWGAVLSLQHLQVLYIEHVDKVIDVDSSALQMQSSSPLQELLIIDSSAECIESMPWRSFPSLISLELRTIKNLEALPEGIQHLTALQNLQLWNCKSVASIPCWMSHLSSLRSLQIEYCSEELKERCKRQRGEDWPNIQHIPRIIYD